MAGKVVAGRNYFDVTDMLSASVIKSLIKKGVENKAESRALVVGSLVDLVLTEGQKLSDLCIVDNVKIPSPQMKLFCEKLEIISEGGTNLSTENFELAYIETDIKRDSLVQTIAKFQSKENKDYFDHLVERRKKRNDNKWIINVEEEAQVLKCINDVNNSPFASLFKPSNRVFTQLEIYCEGFKIKLDSLVFNDELQRIEPKDLKTIGSYAENGLYNIVSFRYDIQAYLYNLVLKKILSGVEFETNDPNFIKTLEECGHYQLSDTFDFIFCSKYQEGAVLEFKYRLEDVKELLGKELYTRQDIISAKHIFDECIQNGIKPSLSNYMILNNYSIVV